MELKEIIAISGQPGLYRYVAQSKNGIIVESLAYGKRSNASASSKVSSLSEIAIFTEGDDVPLATVFENLYAHTKGEQTISHKSSNDELKALLAAVLPQFDRDRVHVSDIKKLVSWFNTLVAAGMKEFKIDEEPQEEAQK